MQANPDLSSNLAHPLQGRPISIKHSHAHPHEPDVVGCLGNDCEAHDERSPRVLEQHNMLIQFRGGSDGGPLVMTSWIATSRQEVAPSPLRIYPPLQPLCAQLPPASVSCFLQGRATHEDHRQSALQLMRAKRTTPKIEPTSTGSVVKLISRGVGDAIVHDDDDEQTDQGTRRRRANGRGRSESEG